MPNPLGTFIAASIIGGIFVSLMVALSVIYWVVRIRGRRAAAVFWASFIGDLY